MPISPASRSAAGRDQANFASSLPGTQPFPARLDGSGAPGKLRLGLLEDKSQSPFGRSSHRIRQAAIGCSAAGGGRNRGLAEHARSVVNGAGVPDDLIRYDRRSPGSGDTAHHDPLSLPDPDRDAVIKAGGAAPHPVGPPQRTPNRRAEGVQLARPVPRLNWP